MIFYIRYRLYIYESCFWYFKPNIFSNIYFLLKGWRLEGFSQETSNCEWWNDIGPIFGTTQTWGQKWWAISTIQYVSNYIEGFLIFFFFILGESVELWMALWTMGYNHNLQRDESFNFKVSLRYYYLLKVRAILGLLFLTINFALEFKNIFLYRSKYLVSIIQCSKYSVYVEVECY